MRRPKKGGSLAFCSKNMMTPSPSEELETDEENIASAQMSFGILLAAPKGSPFEIQSIAQDRFIYSYLSVM